MNAIVIFTIGEIEIKTDAVIPVSSAIPEEGKKTMVANNAISKIKRELGIDLFAFDERINEKATIIFDERLKK